MAIRLPGIVLHAKSILRKSNKASSDVPKGYLAKHINKKRELLQTAPDKTKVPNIAAPGNASVPTQMLDLGSNFGGSNVATFSGPQEEAPAQAPTQLQVDNWNLEDWAEFIRDCPLI
ncbi:hypothetical protein ACFE04_017378 [Oxalis oulophora]